jgi:RND family efflux transporter MFP subunit
LAQAEVRLQSAEAQWDVLMQGPHPQAVAEAEAKLAAAAAAAEAAATRLAYYQLRSPIAGTVENIRCHPGQTIDSNSPVATVADLSELYLTVWSPPRQAQRIRPACDARVCLDEPLHVAASSDASDDSEQGSASANGKALTEGKVVFLGREADPQTGNVPVKVLLRNPREAIALGTVLRVDFVVGIHQDTLAVPTSALVDFEGEPSLYVIRDGKAARIAPVLGVRQHGLVEVIADSLDEGEPVVTEGAYNLPEGTEVKAVE